MKLTNLMLFCPLGPGSQVNIYNGAIFESMNTFAIIQFGFFCQFDLKWGSPVRLEGLVKKKKRFYNLFFVFPGPQASGGLEP